MGRRSLMLFRRTATRITHRGHVGSTTSPLTIADAVRELDNSMRLGAQTTFYRLGEDPGLARFVDSMAARVGGRGFWVGD